MRQTGDRSHIGSDRNFESAVMDIPDYVPEEIRRSLITQREAIASQTDHWTRSQLERDHNVLTRIVCDDRMCDVFGILNEEELPLEQKRSFIIAAWSALGDYSLYKDRRALAKDLLKRVRTKAAELASLVQQLRDTGLYLSPELISPDAIVEVPFGPGVSVFDSNLKAARAAHFMKTMAIKGTGPEMENLARDYPPDIVLVLRNAAQAAKQTNSASLVQHIPGKIQTRQRNRKNDFIRAFAIGLEGHDIALTDSVMKAMAITACVALDDPDIDVTVQDVRTALSRPNREPQ
jgi:hypothetical protein